MRTTTSTSNTPIMPEGDGLDREAHERRDVKPLSEGNARVLAKVLSPDAIAGVADRYPQGSVSRLRATAARLAAIGNSLTPGGRP